ncbi:hypothetical protein K7X08_022378 [Anisodus acutangulus]|uniref:Uncharacterized protein n=1 Tax=Anisodus acutangulus TaxID=402998 RepID=A0A9Q1RHK8_9SOLA|nr:hypothetical protein K7X08_022378 [Anisodus acutangulus]
MIVTNDDPYITFKHYTDVADGEVNHKNGNGNDVHAAHTVHGGEVDNGILHGVVVDDGILHAKEEDTLSDVIVGHENEVVEHLEDDGPIQEDGGHQEVHGGLIEEKGGHR